MILGSNREWLFSSWSLWGWQTPSSGCIWGKVLAPTCLSRSTMNHWAWHFHTGVNTVHPRKLTGRQTKLTQAKVQTLCVNWGLTRVSMKELARRVGLGATTIHKALTKVLKLRKQPSKWVTHELTDAQKAAHVHMSCGNIHLWNHQCNLATHIMTGDESWIFSYDPVSKQATSVWIHPREIRPQKVRLECATQKVMLLLFFDDIEAVHPQWVWHQCPPVPGYHAQAESWMPSDNADPACGRQTTGFMMACPPIDHSVSNAFWPSLFSGSGACRLLDLWQN